MSEQLNDHAMRRKDRELPTNGAEEILRRCDWGVLSMVDDKGQPYGIPVSYVFGDGAIYIHCAFKGHKLDCIAHKPHVSFCVVNQAITLPERFSVQYASAIAYGTAEQIGGEEKLDALKAFITKYSSEFEDEGAKYIERAAKNTCVVKLTIERITGKASTTG